MLLVPFNKTYFDASDVPPSVILTPANVPNEVILPALETPPAGYIVPLVLILPSLPTEYNVVNAVSLKVKAPEL